MMGALAAVMNIAIETNHDAVLHIFIEFNSHLISSSAQADGYSLVWHRARQKSRVHPSSGEGLGAELSQTL